MDDFYALV